MTFVLIIISALLTGLCYTFYRVGFLAFLTVIPLFIVMLKRADENKNPVRTYFMGYLWGVVYFASVYYWFSYQYPLEYLGFSKGEAIAYVALTWFGIGALLSFVLALWQLSFAFFAKSWLYKTHKLLFIPFVSAFYVVLEFVFTLGKLASPWARLAITQQSYTFGIQTASVFGSYFISFLVIFVNATLAFGIYTFIKNKNKKTLIVCTSVALGSLLLNFLAGIGLYYSDKNISDKLETYQAAALQGNLVSGRKSVGGTWETLDLFFEMAEEDIAENKTKLIVLPESAFSVVLESSEAFKNELLKFSEKHGVVIIFTCYQYDEEDNLYCAAWCVSPDGSISGPYRKQHPVPFGEFTPAREFILKLLPFIEDVTDLGQDLSAGNESVVFDSSVGKIGCYICFDSAFENIGYEAAQAGAEIFMESTNDSWWMDSSQLYEHNGHAIMRAIETRRCVVRSAAAGYSTVINSRGEIVDGVEPLTKGAASGGVYNRSDLSFYSKYPNLFLSFCFIYVLEAGIWAAAVEIKQKMKNKENAPRQNA